MTDFKECKAWARVSKNGEIGWYWSEASETWLPSIARTRKEARSIKGGWEGERVVRVRIVRDEG